MFSYDVNVGATAGRRIEKNGDEVARRGLRWTLSPIEPRVLAVLVAAALWRFL